MGRAGLACDPEKLLAVWVWHTPGSVKQVRQFIGFVGYYRQFIQNFAELSESLVTLTHKGTVFAWTSERQDAFEVLGGILNQIQGDQPESPAVSTSVLYYTSGNIGCCCVLIFVPIFGVLS